MALGIVRPEIPLIPQLPAAVAKGISQAATFAFPIGALVKFGLQALPARNSAGAKFSEQYGSGHGGQAHSSYQRLGRSIDAEEVQPRSTSNSCAN